MSNDLSDKIYTGDLCRVIDALSILRFFPKEARERAQVIGILHRMCNNQRELYWLLDRALIAWNDWPGPRDLRALFCTKFRPRDGVYVSFAQPFGDSSSEEHVQSLHDMAYADYLLTDHWRIVRNQKLRDAEFLCQLCNSSDSLEVHHRTYERRGCEASGDLIVLCRDCHQLFHERQKVASAAGI